MEAKAKRKIKSGAEYDHLFPRSENNTATIRRNANVGHTVAFIPKVVNQTIDQTKGISKLLNANNTYETCRNIWQFVYDHINYKKDQDGFEQIRSPARSWHDRTGGVDCDCYTVFISSILTNLGIPHSLRITKYHRDYFQHIYPVVPYNGKTITLDCVTDNFDYEVPYKEKKDYPMDLQYLNGFDGDGMEDLGKIIKKNMAKNKKPSPLKAKALPIAKKAGKGLLKKAKKKAASKSVKTPSSGSAPAPMPAVKKKKKGIFKKVLNVVNKVNPATVLLRNGVLAAMKLNIKNIAARLRWSYLTPQQAEAKGLDPAKFQKLVATRQKLEKIFYGAGGKEANLRKAILGGKGNKDKAVSGLGMLPKDQWSGYMNENTPLQHLLGPEIYYSENVEGMGGFRGFGELGEPVTLTSVGAAMGVLAGIVAALKQIGDVFKKNAPGSADFDERKTEAPENNVVVPPNNQPEQLPAILPAEESSTSSENVTSKINNDNTSSENSEIAPERAMITTSANFSPPATTEESPEEVPETNSQSSSEGMVAPETEDSPNTAGTAPIQVAALTSPKKVFGRKTSNG